MPPRVSSKSEDAMAVETTERATVVGIVLVEKAEMCCFPAVRRRAERLAIFMVATLVL